MSVSTLVVLLAEDPAGRLYLGVGLEPWLCLGKPLPSSFAQDAWLLTERNQEPKHIAGYIPADHVHWRSPEQRDGLELIATWRSGRGVRVVAPKLSEAAQRYIGAEEG